MFCRDKNERGRLADRLLLNIYLLCDMSDVADFRYILYGSRFIPTGEAIQTGRDGYGISFRTNYTSIFVRMSQLYRFNYPPIAYAYRLSPVTGVVTKMSPLFQN